MIYLTNGNAPLNAAYADEIVQIDSNTYQLTFRFPTSDSLWEKLKEETFLTADDLHGEQDFVIFEVEKKHGYIQVYANQVFTLLNNYVVNPISLDRQTGSTALSRFASAITRNNPFSFFSDIEDRHTFNIGSKNAMEAFAKDKHSILGQWDGDLVRHGYQVRLLKNGGSENESLFMYKKNLSSYQHKTSTKSLKTRITFTTTIKGEGEKAPDRTFAVTIDSPLINKYSQIYEDVIEVNDQDVKDEASLRKYGEQYFKTSLCDMMEDSLELQVVGQSDVPVQIYDIVSLFYEIYNLDVRKKITKYTYSPMAKKLKSIGFGQFQSGLANAIGNAVSDAVKGEVQQLQDDFERQLARELKNADLAFDRQKEELVNQFTDGLNAAKAKAEEVKRELSDTIDQRFNSFNNGPLQEAKRRAEEALRNAGASTLLAQEAKRISEQATADITKLKSEVVDGYVGKNTYQEGIRGIERRIEEVKASANGQVATQIAEYKKSVDGRFTSLSSQLDGKANLIDFQRVRETSQLYERIIGSNENDISNKVARMALTNQLFQVEVAKNASSGQNLLKGSKNFSGYWKNMAHGWKKHSDKYQGCDVLFKNNSWNGIGQEIDAKIGEIYTFSLWMRSDWKNDTVNFYVNKNGSVEKGWGVPSETSVAITNEWKRYSFTFKITADGFIFPRVERPNQNTNLYIAGLKLEKGSYATSYTEAPEDTDEAIRSVQSQLAGSWSVQNINSAGDLISGINLGANGHNRFDGKLTHITGETLIDKAVIKSAMVDKLKTANFEAGSVTTIVLDAEAVTAEKLKVDQAFFNKLVANEAYLSQLFAKQAFINRVQSVAIDASQVRSGILSGDRIYGGTIRGASIYGGTLTGHTQIKLGSYGSFDTVNGGLQINVPRDYNAKDGLGVQFIGSYGRGENVPYGLFLYRDSDFTIGNTATDTDEFLMTVQGYINAKGIGWMRTGKGSVNGKTTATIGLWDSNNVSLDFGGSGNDIYYSYNGSAYSLWSVVNQHFSDSRLKENIVDCKHKALDYIHQFQFKEYDWKKQEDRPQQAHTKIGLIAQEVQTVDPTLVYENGDTLNLDNLRLTNIALKAIQELAIENQKLTHRLENLENEYRTA